LWPVAQPHIWSNSLAISTIAAGPNDMGTIGISGTVGGDGFAPSHVIGLLTQRKAKSLPASFQWQIQLVETGGSTLRKEASPRHEGRWGDYFSVVPDPANPRGWLTVTLTLQNDDDDEQITDTSQYRPVSKIVAFWQK
jgi:hypothetical protein